MEDSVDRIRSRSEHDTQTLQWMHSSVSDEQDARREVYNFLVDNYDQMKELVDVIINDSQHFNDYTLNILELIMKNPFIAEIPTEMISSKINEFQENSTKNIDLNDLGGIDLNDQKKDKHIHKYETNLINLNK